MPLLCCRSNSILTSCTGEQYLYSFSMLGYNFWLSTNVHTHAVGDFQHRISELGQKMLTVLSQHSPPVVNSGSGSEGVDTPEDNPTLEMQRYYYRPPS